jgi:hypothetical protein
MNDADQYDCDAGKAVRPAAPEMAAADPKLFVGLNTDENTILNHHLTSGWHKQSAVYPALSEPWKETSAVLDDLAAAWRIRWQAEHEPEAVQ